jgi:hypothetical protein
VNLPAPFSDIVNWPGMLGVMACKFAAGLKGWQPLVAAGVAIVAVSVAFRNTTRSLNHAEQLERRRRSQKQAALRAVLPLALAQVTDYAERSAHALNRLVAWCDRETLPNGTANENLAERLPSESIKTFADFIEYADQEDVTVLTRTIAWIQILDARVRTIVKDNNDPSGTKVVVRADLEGRIIDAASIYAGAASIYEYARGLQPAMPATLTWDNVGAALRNMGFWPDENPRLDAIVTDRETRSSGPFERLNA